MPQPVVRRIALRAMQLAITAAGILIVFLAFSRQADAAALDPPPVSSAPGLAASPVTSVATSVASEVTSAVSGVTSGCFRGHPGCFGRHLRRFAGHVRDCVGHPGR